MWLIVFTASPEASKDDGGSIDHDFRFCLRENGATRQDRNTKVNPFTSQINLSGGLGDQSRVKLCLVCSNVQFAECLLVLTFAS